MPALPPNPLAPVNPTEDQINAVLDELYALGTEQTVIDATEAELRAELVITYPIVG